MRHSQKLFFEEDGYHQSFVIRQETKGKGNGMNRVYLEHLEDKTKTGMEKPGHSKLTLNV